MNPSRPQLRIAALVATAWLVILALMLGLGWLLTHPWHSSVGGWDDDVERWMADRRNGVLDPVAAAGTLLGNSWTGLAVAVVIAAVTSRQQRSLRPAAFFAVLVAGGLALYLACTQLITRDRPPVPILDPGLVPDHSFPSGHVITAVVVYGGAALLLARREPRTAPWLWLLLLVAPFVALCRMYQGAHHPTDVLAGLVSAAAWVVIVRTALLPRPEDVADAP